MNWKGELERDGAPPEQLESSWLVQYRQAAREIPDAKIVLALWVGEHTEREKKSISLTLLLD